MDIMNEQQFAAILDGMRVMIQTATEATRQATDAQLPSGGQVDQQWSRILPRPAIFAPTNKEDELICFPDWKWEFQQYVNGISPEMGLLMTAVEEHADESVPMNRLNEEKQAQSMKLYALLGSMMKGRAGQIIRAQKDNTGFESWRLILKTLSPESKSRSLALLGAITAYQLSEELKIAVVLKALPPVIKNYVSVLTEEDIDYNRLREVLMMWERTQQKWTGQTSIAGGFDGSQATDMDIGRIQNKGKGKNKGKESKDKGKFDSKGKSKGYAVYGSGGKSQYDQKGKGKGDNKGKGKGGKKGKSSDWNSGHKTNAVCYSCGKTGHMQKDCWSRARDSNVKQVADGHEAASSATSTVPSSATALNSQNANRTIKRIFYLEDDFPDEFDEDFAYVNDVAEAHDDWCNAVFAEQFCGCLSCSSDTNEQIYGAVEMCGTIDFHICVRSCGHPQ